ncbi:MAG: cyanase [Verrucomicrobia bacterium]|nr:cyanase [Verrucomicrobiota bacterium]
MTKTEMIEAIKTARKKQNTTWAAIAGAVGLSEIFVTSACLGQNSLGAEDAGKLVAFLGLPADVSAALQECPLKASGVETVAKDPLIYRFFEIAYVYGDSLKEIIHEKFGDGIMSAIDFTLHVEKVEDPKGDRVKVVMNGKFLPYKKW